MLLLLLLLLFHFIIHFFIIPHFVSSSLNAWKIQKLYYISHTESLLFGHMKWLMLSRSFRLCAAAAVALYAHGPLMSAAIYSLSQSRHSRSFVCSVSPLIYIHTWHTEWIYGVFFSVAAVIALCCIFIDGLPTVRSAWDVMVNDDSTREGRRKVMLKNYIFIRQSRWQLEQKFRWSKWGEMSMGYRYGAPEILAADPGLEKWCMIACNLGYIFQRIM